MKKLNFHIIQHVEFEKADEIEDWAKNNGHTLQYTHVYSGDSFPKPENFDVLVIMGGPMSVYDDDKYKWIKNENKFIQKCIEHEKIILGICLGAQFIAKALGAKVYKGPVKEIGWFPVNFHYHNNSIFPKSQVVFHWHGDTFDIPEGAIPLASSEAILNQGFIYNDNVFALQFHLETKQSSVNNMLKECAGDLTTGKYVQEEARISEDNRYYHQNKEIMNKLLTYLCSRIN